MPQDAQYNYAGWDITSCRVLCNATSSKTIQHEVISAAVDTCRHLSQSDDVYLIDYIHVIKICKYNPKMIIISFFSIKHMLLAR